MKHIGELQQVHLQVVYKRDMLVFGSYGGILYVVALIGIIIHPYIPKLYNRPGCALGLKYHSVSSSVFLQGLHTALASLKNVHWKGSVISTLYAGSQAAGTVLIYRGIILELLADRALLAIHDLLHKIACTPCFLHLQLAQPYKILSLGLIGIAQ